MSLSLRPRSIRLRLMFLCVGASLLITLLALGSFIVLEDRDHLRRTIEEATSLATTVGDNSHAALVFGDQAAAASTLASLRSVSALRFAELVDTQGRIFAGYPGNANLQPPFPPPGAPDDLLLSNEIRAWRQEPSGLLVFYPIVFDDERVGGLLLRYSLADYQQRWQDMRATGGAILLGAFFLSWLVADRISRLIIAPIEQLGQAMDAVRDGNLQVRLVSRHRDEIAVLIRGFNAMLEHIAARDRMLEELNSSLEVRIQERTAAFRQSELRYRSLFESSPISLWEEDLSGAVAIIERLKTAGVTDFAAHFRAHPEIVASCAAAVRIIDVNDRTLALYRARDRDTLFGRLDQIFTENSFERFADVLVAIAAGSTSCFLEGTNRDLEGNEIVVALSMSVVPGHERDYSRVVIAIEDITTRKAMENQLRSTLREKELLIQEVHHRVKNNLQIISSLINLQIKKVHDETALMQLHSTLLRIRAMALIHEKLFRSSAGSDRFDAFVHELVREVAAVYAAAQRQISIEVNVTPISIEFERMMVFAMIISELLSNALKYAFPDNRRGVVNISVGMETDTIMSLRVRDDGIGLPADFSHTRGEGLGFRLVESLTRQLHGTLAIDGNRGTTVTVRALAR